MFICMVLNQVNFNLLLLEYKDGYKQHIKLSNLYYWS